MRSLEHPIVTSILGNMRDDIVCMWRGRCGPTARRETARALSRRRPPSLSRRPAPEISAEGLDAWQATHR
jgi:hypothetical protein